MPTYANTRLLENVDAIDHGSWNPIAPSTALKPVANTYGTNPSCALAHGSSQVGYWYGKHPNSTTWQLTQAFATNEAIFATTNNSVSDDKVLFEGTYIHFPCTVTRQFETWLMVVAAFPTTDPSSVTESVTTHADVDVALNPFEIALYESDDDGATWTQLSVIHTLETRFVGDTAGSDYWGSGGRCGDPSMVWVDGSRWSVLIPRLAHRETIDYLDCSNILRSRSRFDYWWATTGYQSTDNGATWTQWAWSEEIPADCFQGSWSLYGASVNTGPPMRTWRRYGSSSLHFAMDLSVISSGGPCGVIVDSSGATSSLDTIDITDSYGRPTGLGEDRGGFIQTSTDGAYLAYRLIGGATRWLAYDSGGSVTLGLIGHVNPLRTDMTGAGWSVNDVPYITKLESYVVACVGASIITANFYPNVWEWDLMN